ncbi:MAG TPA: LysR substrate-binding domain-containing protein [Planctomycetota bacterium]|nr:LysR substrate-binding domain-containing protein [Planctomycetota bacterium]
MDLEQLRAFYYAAKLQGFTAAAKKLHLTQPAISQKVKSLEQWVGEALMERVGRRIFLTPAGEILYAQAEALIARVDEIEQVVRDLRSLETGRLAVGASDTTSLYVLPELLDEFRHLHPGIEVAIESGFSPAVVGRVLDREIDLAIVPLPQEDERLESESFYSERFVCIVNDAHPFAERSEVSRASIADEPLILLGKESFTRRLIETYLGPAGTPLRVAFELSSFEIVKRYVAMGFGISLVPAMVLDPPRPGLRAVPLAERLELRYGAVYRRDRVLSRPAKAFLELVRARHRPAKRTDSRPKGGF